MKFLILFALAAALHAEDAKPLEIFPASVENMTVVSFFCDLGDYEEQGFTKCPDMSIERWGIASPEWTLILGMIEVCPTNDSAFITTRGPVGIAWPESLVLELNLADNCAIRPWIYYHDDLDGSYIGLRLDPLTQRLSVEQSEVAFR